MNDTTSHSGTRTAVLSWHPERHLPEDGDAPRFLAPRAVAAALGLRAETAAAAAHTVLAREGWTVVSPLGRRRRLRDALGEAGGSADPAGALRSIDASVTALLRAGAGAEAPVGRFSDRAARLLDLVRRYRERLDADGLVDPAESVWRAAALARSEAAAHAGRLWAVASAHAAPDERNLLDALAGSGSVLVVPCAAAGAEVARESREWSARGWRVEPDLHEGTALGHGLARRFREGTADADSGLDAVEGAHGARAWTCPSQEDEIRAVLGDVKRRLHDGVPAERMALVASDVAAYAPLVHDVAWELEIPVRSERRLPANRTRVGAWLGLLAEAVRDDATFESTARLLAHPLSGGLDAATWAEARLRRPSDPRAWARAGGDDPRIRALRWPRRASRADHHARLTEALAAFGVADRLQAQAAWEAVALRRLQTAAAALSRPEGDVLGRGAFMAELQELTALVLVPIVVGELGVALYDARALAGGRVDHLFVLGAAEGVLPPPVRDDPVLDFHERAALREGGLPLDDAHALALREERTFEALLRAATDSVTLSHPAALGGQARPPSPYLARLGLTAAPPPERGPSSLEEARRVRLRDGLNDAVTSAALRAWQVEARRESDAPFDHHDGVTGLPVEVAEHPLSATQLLDLGQCAFKWFASRALRVEPPRETEEEITPLQRGQLWHRTLELALEGARRDGARGGAELRASAERGLDDAFARAERETLPDLPTWPLRRQDHLDRLRRVLSREDFLPDGAEVVAIERRFRGSWRGIPVTGRVDRIDRGPDGLALTDYKTRGSKPDGVQDVAGRLRLDIQLPLYTELVEEAYPGEAVAEARYYSLTKAAPIRASSPGDEELDAFVARMRAHLADGDFPVRPDPERNACRLCDLEPVCRRGPRLDRKPRR